MKHLKKGRKFGRERDQRKALLKSLILALFDKEKITTTEAKAKEIKPYAEKFITKSKKPDISLRREIARYFHDEIAKKLINEIAPRYKERPGGYARIIKLGRRKSDGARMAILELIK